MLNKDTHLVVIKKYNYLCIKFTKVNYQYMKNFYDPEEYDGKIAWNKESQKFECKYWRPAVAVDAVLFGYGEVENKEKTVKDPVNEEKALHVLLINRKLEPYAGMWALPGGFMIETDQSAEDAVRRELYEETNVDHHYLKEFGVFSNKNRDIRPDHIISIAFYDLVKIDFKVKGGSDAREAKWFPLTDLPKLAFDHEDIINKAYEKLKSSAFVEPIAKFLLRKEFTITELFNLYFAILYPDFNRISEEEKNRITGKFNRGNFVKKINRLGYFVPIDGRVLKDTAYRPPKLYQFDDEKFTELKKEGEHLEFDFRRKKNE